MDPSAFVPILMVGYVVIAIVVGLYREWQDSAYSETELKDWTDWAQRSGLRLSGAYPNFTVHGQIDGVIVNLRHDVQYGSKGSRKYSVEASATVPGGAANLSVLPVGILSRFFGAGSGPVPVGSGEVSLAQPLPEAGRLSPSPAGVGALSDPLKEDSAFQKRDLEDVLAELPNPSRIVELDADFARRFEVSPRDAIIPPKVKLALVDSANFRIESGKVWFFRNSLARCAEARNVVTKLVQIARALR